MAEVLNVVEIQTAREAWLDDKAKEIKALEQKAVEAMLKTGAILIEVKKRTSTGEWQKWLRENLDYSGSKARGMMRAYRRFRDDPDVLKMNVSTVHYLTHSPDEKVAEVKQRWSQPGPPPSAREVKAILYPEKVDPNKELEAALDEEQEAHERALETIYRLKARVAELEAELVQARAGTDHETGAMPAKGENHG